MSKQFREYTLDNGMHVALRETDTGTAYAVLRVFYGSLNELPEEHGIAHFLEHNLVLGGTDKHSPKDMKKQLLKLGNWNAATMLDQTQFYADMKADRIESFLDLSSNMFFNPTFDNTILEQEKQRVLREISMKKSAIGFHDARHLNKLLFGEGSPHTYFVLGTEDIVNNATADTLRNFHKRGFTSNNMQLIISGGLPDNIDSIIQKYFKDKPQGKDTKIIFPESRQLSKKIIYHVPGPEKINLEKPEESNAYLDLTFKVVPVNHHDAPAIEIVNNILGVDTNSRIFERISSQMGLAYSIGSSYSGLNNEGTIAITGEVHSARLNETVNAVFEEFKKLQTKKIESSDLKHVIDAFEFGLLKSTETNGGSIGNYIREKDNTVNTDEYLDAMDKITPQKFIDVANKYLPSDRETGKYILYIRDPLKKD